MDKKAVAEVRKLFRRTDCRIDKLRGCFVNEEKNRIFDIRESFLALEDEEMSKYCEIFSKTLSGRIGRNLFEAEFPLAEEDAGGRQHFLRRLEQSQLENDALLEEFYEKVIDTLDFSGKYLILLAHGVYDIPMKTKDGLDLEDASEEVYSFLLCSICPVELLREGLCYDGMIQAFRSRTSDWGVKKPMAGLLYPAFTDRQPDIHSVLWYAAKGEDRHEELSDALIGAELPMAEKQQKNVFRGVIEESLGRDCDFERVRNITEAVARLAEEAKDEPNPVQLGKREVRQLLEDGGADEEVLKKFDAVYDEQVEPGTALMAENLADTARVEVKSPVMKVSIRSEAAALLETRVIGGQEYLLVPLSDEVELNGIRILQTRALDTSAEADE